MSDIKELTKWCEEARALLGYATVFNDASSDMKAAITKVSEKLGQLAKLASQVVLSEALMAKFELLATEAKALVDRSVKGKKEEKARIEEIKAMTPRLSKLAEEISLALPLAKAQDAYLVKLEKCQNRRDIFASLPRPDPTPLNELINSAKGLAGLQDQVKSLASATTMLDSFDSVQTTAKGVQKKAAAEKEKQRNAMPACIEKFKQVTAVLEYVEAEGVGLSEQKATLSKGLQDAAALREKGDWLGAAGILAGMPTRQACELAGAEALKKATQIFPDVKLGQTAIAKLKGLVDADMAKGLEARLWEAIDGVATQIVGPNEMRALKGMVDVINERISWAEKEGPKLAEQIRTLQASLNSLGQVAPVAEALPLKDGLERIKAHQSRKEISTAQDRAVELLVSVDQAVLTWTQRKQAWDAVSGPFAAMGQQLDTQMSDKEAPQDLRDAATQQKARYGTAARLLEGRDWSALVALHASIKLTLGGFEKGKKAYADFAAARGIADVKAKSEFTALQKKLDALRQQLTDAGVAPDKAMAPLEQGLKAVIAGWDEKLSHAVGDAELDLGSTLLALAQLEKQSVAAGSVDGVAGAKDALLQDQLRARFAELLDGLANPYAILDTLDPKLGLGLRARVAKIEADAGKPWAERVSALEVVAGDIAKAARTAELARNERNSNMRNRCQLLSSQLEGQWNEMKKGKGKKFQALFDALRGELEDLTLLADTPNLEAAKANQSALDSLQSRLNDMKTLTPDGEDPLQTVVDGLAALKKRFGDLDTELKANVPKTLVSLKKRLATLETDLYSMDISKSTAEISALDQALDQASDEAEKKVIFRGSVVELIPVVERHIELMKSDGRAPDYAKALEKRFAAARKSADDPNKLNSAKQELDRLLKDLQTAIQNPEDALGKQKVLLLEAQRKDLLEIEWTASLKTFKAKVLPRAEAAVGAPGSDPTQVDEINRMLGMAEEAAKSKDHTEALRRLRLAEQRVEEVVADPSGPGIGSRRALPQNAKQYGEAVKGVLEALKVFPDQVAAKVPGLPKPVTDRISSSVAGFPGMLDETAFDAFAATLSDGKAPARARREAREAALQKIRDLQALLVDHPVLTGLLVNPISVNLHLAAKLLNQRLTSLDANIRRSVH